MKIISTFNNRPLINLSDWEIIQTICNEDINKSRQAFNEFYFRYKSYLLKVCRNCCISFESSDMLADDIFQNTFLKVFKKARTFKLLNPENNSNINREIKAWLSKIAKNELVNFLRENPDEKALSNPFRLKSYDLEDKIPDIFENDENNIIAQEQPSIHKNQLDRALYSLSEKERYIIMTYMQFFDPLNINKHLPGDILKGICYKFNLKPDNVRQIKKRALRKIKEKISTYSNNSI